ncbi:uncharacterized protein LOC112510807 [Cynara cardunculus var. scolymus]|uniref:uncharacterized protein LOC112510807 n=1 Tax=Cynara cardunculus var. scolymus TaxID=59895 RepID=UPI000D6277D7|nr:uncharacterized protein LOC112510807 [Cynara cardunculus var. scolymus]
MVRCLLNEKNMPKVFWAEIAQWCMYILNMSLTTTVKEKTPQEAWTGSKPNVNFFRVFGCMNHSHIPDKEKVTLYNKRRKCVFLGLIEESKAYRLMARPREAHMLAVKRVLRYIKCIVELGLFYKKHSDGDLKAYTDSDFVGDTDGAKSTSGYVFLMSGATELVKDGEVKLEYYDTKEQVADIMTKPVKLETFIKFREMLGVICKLKCLLHIQSKGGFVGLLTW